MTSITVAIDVLGMSGQPWQKKGEFKSPENATAFLMLWWGNLSCPTGWNLEINGKQYSSADVPIQESTVREHIDYCLDLHRAFW